MSTLDSLQTILTNVRANKANIMSQLAQITPATVTPEVQAAMDLLVETYSSNVQLIGQAIGQQMQVKMLKQTLPEIDLLISAMQVVVADEALVEATGAVAEANNALPEVEIV